MALNIVVLYGSVRTERLGIRAARFFVEQITKAGHEAMLVDPMEYKLPLLDKRYKDFEKGKAPAIMEKISGILTKADAFVVVSGEYNNSIPPALNNLIDHFYPEYAFKPSALVTYSAGAFGGVRNLANLRAIMGEVGTASIPPHFPIPKVQEAFDTDGKAQDASYEERAAKFLGTLFWYAQALKEARKTGLPK